MTLHIKCLDISGYSNLTIVVKVKMLLVVIMMMTETGSSEEKIPRGPRTFAWVHRQAN
jgi:hypothetical protein